MGWGTGAAAVLACTCSVGCSLIVDTDQFGGGVEDAAATLDAGALDASGLDGSGLDGRAVVDANLSALALTGVTPPTVWEAEGASAAAPPVPFIITGTDIGQDAVVTASHPDVTVVDSIVGVFGTSLAVSLRIPVLLTTGTGDSLPLTLTVTQPGATDTVEITINGLDELDVRAGEYTPDGLVYSSIVVSGAVQLGGNEAARLISMSDIVVDGAISVDATSAFEPGPGGCAGGASGTAGLCASGGGRPGVMDVALGKGGGGGSCGTTGDAGENGGGAPGVANCSELVSALGSTNQSAGGGGGGDSTAGFGGTGGAGGGSLELFAGGAIKLNANISSAGSNGTPGTGTACTDHGGGGGGGSGGIVVLRAMKIERTSSSVRVKGGQGAAGGADCERGGNGGLGRIRIDATSIVAPVAGDDPFAQGPVLSSTTPVITNAAMLPVTLVGEPETSFLFFVDGDGVTVVRTDDTGTKVVNTDLTPGHHTVCVTTLPLGGEWETCRKIAVVP